MRVSTPTISWHNRERVSSLDFQPAPFPGPTPGAQTGSTRLATAGDDKHVIVSIFQNISFVPAPIETPLEQKDAKFSALQIRKSDIFPNSTSFRSYSRFSKVSPKHSASRPLKPATNGRVLLLLFDGSRS